MPDDITLEIIHKEICNTRTELKNDIGEIRADIGGIRTEQANQGNRLTAIETTASVKTEQRRPWYSAAANAVVMGIGAIVGAIIALVWRS